VIGQKWLTIAANMPYTFYGHLAHLAIQPDNPLPLPKPVSILLEARSKNLRKTPYLSAALALFDANEVTLAKRFIHQIIANA
jgi:hypothetical protein